jgi:hypothetical protein
MRTTLLTIIINTILSGANLSAQIPNNGFENWTLDVNNDLNPDGYETTNSDTDVSVEQYSPAYAGTYSMKVKTFDPGFMTIPGFAMIEFPLTSRPDCFTVCFKSTIMPGDGAYIIFSLWSGDSIIASPGNCTFNIDSSYANYTCLTYPITYQSALTPDSANIMIVAGTASATLGTEIIVDELSFNCTSSIQNNEFELFREIYPNPSAQVANLPVNMKSNNELDLFVYDLHGKLVKTIHYGWLTAGEHALTLSVEDLANGVYMYRLQGINSSQTGKFTVAH